MKRTFTIIVSLLFIPFTFAQAPYFSWVGQLSNTEQEIGQCVTVDNNNNVIVGGSFENYIDVDPSANTYQVYAGGGGSDAFVAKYDSAGSLIWGFAFGGSDIDEVYAIDSDPFGNIYVTGQFSGTANIDPLGMAPHDITSTGYGDIFVCKYNTSGVLVWGYSFGSAAGDMGYGIDLDHLGNVYVTGWFTNTVDFDPGVGTSNLVMLAANDAFLLKLDNSGNFSWAKQVAGSDTDEGFAIDVDNAGNVYWGGVFKLTADLNYGGVPNSQTSNGFTDAFLNKYNSSGVLQWSKNFGGPFMDYIRDIELDKDNNLYVSGHFGSTVDFDPGGGASNLTAVSFNDIFLSKFDANGNFRWVKQRNATTEATLGVACKIHSDTTGNIYAAGSFSGTVDFDPNGGISNQSATTQNAYICALDSGGSYQWVSRLSGEYSKFFDFIRTSEGIFYATGLFNNTCDFDPGVGSESLTATGSSDAFILRLTTPIPNSGVDLPMDDSIIMFPNPVVDLVYFRSTEWLSNSNISVIDLTGKSLININNLNGLEFSLDMTALSPGIYFIKMSNNGMDKIYPIIKK